MNTPPNIELAFNEKFMSKETFAQEIEKIVLHTGLNYIDSIVEYCNENDMEIETASKLISKVLKEKIKCDAIGLNYIRNSPQTKISFE